MGGDITCCGEMDWSGEDLTKEHHSQCSTGHKQFVTVTPPVALVDNPQGQWIDSKPQFAKGQTIIAKTYPAAYSSTLGRSFFGIIKEILDAGHIVTSGDNVLEKIGDTYNYRCPGLGDQGSKSLATLFEMARLTVNDGWQCNAEKIPSKAVSVSPIRPLLEEIHHERKMSELLGVPGHIPHGISLEAEVEYAAILMYIRNFQSDFEPETDVYRQLGRLREDIRNRLHSRWIKAARGSIEFNRSAAEQRVSTLLKESDPQTNSSDLAKQISEIISPDPLHPAPVDKIEEWLSRGQRAAAALDKICPLAPLPDPK